MEKFNWNEAEYDAYVRARLLIETEEATQEERFLEGQSVGLEKGVAIGIEKGKLEGREEGGQLKALEIAKAMLAKGMDVKTVADLTGLSVEMIQGS
jgi:predicted transposase/invertase (TIGR01784 family)